MGLDKKVWERLKNLRVVPTAAPADKNGKHPWSVLQGRDKTRVHKRFATTKGKVIPSNNNRVAFIRAMKMGLSLRQYREKYPKG